MRTRNQIDHVRVARESRGSGNRNSDLFIFMDETRDKSMSFLPPNVARSSQGYVLT